MSKILILTPSSKFKDFNTERIWLFIFSVTYQKPFHRLIEDSHQKYFSHCKN